MEASELMSYKEAWHLMMESEANFIQHNKTCDLVELLKNQPALPCKWVYRLKETSDSAFPKYKAMLVAKVSDNNMASISMSGENDHPLVLIRRSDS